MKLLICSYLNICMCLLFPLLAFAEHAIDVEKAAVAGKHFEALTIYDHLPKRIRTIDTTIAAAKSAWALGLTDRAIHEYETALEENSLSNLQKSRIFLSRGIIEFQESRWQVAILYAEKIFHLLKAPHAMRGQAWLLWADSLTELGSFGAAETKYKKALEEAGEEVQVDIHFRLAQCQMNLGKIEEAKQNFKQVPLNHERTASSLRYLTEIALQTNDISSAEFWLKKGRSEYRNDFLDSWVDYALMQIAIAKQDLKEVRTVRANALKKYPPSDNWITLMEAAAEGFEWKNRQRLASRKSGV